MGQSRRDLIKKAAVGGGLVWAAPAITSVAQVHAAVGTPPPGTTTTTGAPTTTTTTGAPTTTTTTTPVCVCAGSAFALSASGLIDIAPIGNDPGTINVSAGALGIEASVLASSFDQGSCTASASVASLGVEVLGGTIIAATVLTSSVDAPCDCSGGGSASVASLNVLGTAINTSVGPNTMVNVGPVLGVSVQVVINEQFCEPGGQGVARALRLTITALGIDQEIIVSESRAGNDVCSCSCCPVSFA